MVKTKSQRVWGLTPTFRGITVEKLVGGGGGGGEGFVLSKVGTEICSPEIVVSDFSISEK